MNHLDEQLVGLPRYGVTLSGSPDNPVIENRSGRTIIAYRLKKADQNGRGQIHEMLLAFSEQPEGIPDGGAVYVRGNRIKASGEGPIVRATLQNLIFADGQFVGADEHGTFESFGRRMKAMVEVGLLGKAGAWDQVEALVWREPLALEGKALAKLSRVRPPDGEDPGLYFDRRVAAERLAQERKFKGEAAAAQLAEIYSSLPTLWK